MTTEDDASNSENETKKSLQNSKNFIDPDRQRLNSKI